jgi:hypothetical protein
MKKGGDRRKTGEGPYVPHRHNDARQSQRANREAREVNDIIALIAAAEALLTSSDDQKRAQQPVAEQQDGDAQQQGGYWCEDEATRASSLHVVHDLTISEPVAELDTRSADELIKRLAPDDNCAVIVNVVASGTAIDEPSEGLHLQAELKSLWPQGSPVWCSQTGARGTL